MRPPVKDCILATVGCTPLVRLNRYLQDPTFSLLAKLESFNPGGSSKDRPALAILEHGRRSGAILPDTVVIESSSGNMGIGLAQACRYFGLRFICVVDPKASSLNLSIMRAYGAELDLVTAPDPASGEWLPARLARVQSLLLQIPKAFWPNQYTNTANAESHYRTTMAEVVESLDGRLDFIFIATSTCGTIRGCGNYIREHRLPTRIVAVDAVGSLIFEPVGRPAGVASRRLIPGLGAGIRPQLCDPTLVDRVVLVTDADCIHGCRRLASREAILAGGSAGGVLTAVEKLRGWIPPGSVCVAILPDRGERYLDTIFNDAWVQEHIGAIEAPIECEVTADTPAAVSLST